MSQSDYTPQETARRGDEIYDREIRSRVEEEHRGEVVAIDIETGRYALGKTAVAASGQILRERPDAPIWLVRIGERVLHRIGSWSELGPS